MPSALPILTRCRWRTGTNKKSMNKTTVDGMDIYTTPVAQLKAKHKEEWIQSIPSSLMGIGLTLPVITTNAFV